MSVVVWDGEIIAADNRGMAAAIAEKTTKLVIHNDQIISWVGTYGDMLWTLDWYKQGAKIEDWPDWKKDENGAFIVANKEGLVVYQHLPIPMPVEEPFWAWGEGRELAIGAMAHGANAINAAVIACRYCVSCGNGIQAFDVGSLQKYSVSDLDIRDHSTLK